MSEASMPSSTLTIALEDGFEGDQVIVRVGDDVVIDQRDVRTDQRIGLAYAVDVPHPAAPIVVAVEVPNRRLHGGHELSATTTSLGISLLDGAVSIRSSATPFGYA
jgi:hypothetical protein